MHFATQFFYLSLEFIFYFVNTQIFRLLLFNLFLLEYLSLLLTIMLLYNYTIWDLIG